MKYLTRNPRLTLSILALFVLGILTKIFIPFETGAVQSSVSISPEVMFQIPIGLSFINWPLSNPNLWITNTMITSWIVVVIIFLFAYYSTRRMDLVPRGLQNVMEMLIETLLGLTEQVAGSERAKKFYPVVATIFIYVLFSNLVGLIPGIGPIGFIHIQGNEPPKGITVIADAPSGVNPVTESGPVPILAPLLRAPSTDVNMPLALALISVLLTQVYGMQARGMRYWTRFFDFGRLLKGNIAFGLIDVFVGLVELVSEIGKIIAFTFRLFGNLFAGEVVLLIMSFLFLLLPFVFYGLELFVAVIQAFVFFILSVAFMTIATTSHGGEPESHSEPATAH